MLETTARPSAEDNEVEPARGGRYRPSEEAAQEAVRTLLAWAGDDPARPGLADTPGGQTLQDVLKPKGVAIVVRARHDCMSSRGVKKHGSALVTQWFSGALAEGAPRAEFLRTVNLR